MFFTNDRYLRFQRKFYNVLLIGFYILIAALAVIFVNKQMNARKSFYIEKGDIKLALGNNYQLVLKVDNKAYINDGDVTWESSDDKVAIVDQNGVVTGLSKGSVEITARSRSGKLATTYIEIYGTEESHTTISLNEEEIELDIGSSFELIADIETNDPSNTIVTWLSNNDKIASVNDGIVTANKAGKAVIVAKLSDGSSASCTVRVKDTSQDLSSITIESSNINAKIGESFTITPIINDPNKEITSLEWISSNTSVATVNKKGVVTILDKGTATITVLANNGKSATVTININDKAINPKNISLDQASIELSVGDMYTLNYYLEPENASKNIIWSSNNKSVATVNNGTIYANNTGTAIISAVLKNGKTATCVVTVKDNSGNSFRIDRTYLSLKINQTDKLTVYGGNNVKWSSTDNNVVTVDQSGNVKAIGIGTATVKVQNGDGKTIACSVEVKNSIIYKSYVILNESSKELNVGEEFTLIATTVPQNIVVQNVTWTSSNENVATVTNGIVKAKGEGTTIIKAISNNNAAICTIKVVNNNAEVQSISLDKEIINIDVGSSQKINVIFNPTNAANKKVTWSSTDNNIVTVDNGTIKAKKVGTATIIATANNGLKAQATVTVTEKGAVKVKTINLSQKNVTMYIGESITLNAAISPANATNKTITWATSDDNIASVNNGYVVANKVGTVTITALTSNGIKDTCTITVRSRNDEAQSIVINSNENMYVGDNLTLKATILPANVANKTINWSSSDNNIATVDASGNVKALRAGTVIITAKTANNLSSACRITIFEKQIELNSIALNTTNTTLNVGSTINLSVTFNPANATNKTITWTSSDNNVATVDTSGKVTAKKNGTVTITAKAYNGKTATCTIVVNNNIVNVNSITLDKNSASMNVGANITLKATIQPSNATNKNITWTSSNNSIATVDASGKVTAKAAGSVVITATSSNGKQATCAITIKNNNVDVTNISLNYGISKMSVGDTLTLKATIQPSNATNKNISWTSSNTSIATVDKNGNVKALKAGSVTITATSSNGKQATCQITVTNKQVDVTTIYLDKTKVTLDVNGTTKLTAKILPGNATAKNVTWTSNNSSVATVDKNGNVKALKAGNATITATASNGSQATCVITVIGTIDVQSISISNNNINLHVGSVDTLLVNIAPANATNKNISWSSSNANIVSVDQKGNIAAHAEGTVEITATSSNGKQAKAYIKAYRNKIHFLNTQTNRVPELGVNDAILLESNGKYAMIDVANLNEPCQRVDNYLNSIGVQKLEFVVITHWHNDHYECNGRFRDGQGIETDRYYLKNIDSTYKTNLPNQAQIDYEHLKQNGGNKVTLLKDNMTIEFGDYTLELKNMTNRIQILKDNNLCNANHASCDENANSIVIKGTEKYSGKTFYLTGDLQGYRDKNGSVLYNWEYDFARSIGNVDIYKVSHHGHGVSEYTFNNSQEVINTLRPKYSVITNANINQNKTGVGSTMQYLKNVGSKVYFTGCGTVVMTFPTNSSGNIEVNQLNGDECNISDGIKVPRT